MKNSITKFTALVKREFIEHKTGYLWIPAILVGLMLVMLLLSLVGFGNAIHIDEIKVHGISNLGEGLEMAEAKAAEKGADLGPLVSLFYWSLSGFAFVALPFVVFFSLLGSLYEERRDRSVLFFKSMPVSDTLEVLAKLVASVCVAPLALLAVVIAGQLISAFILSFIVMVQGGPFMTLWPLDDMFIGWLSFILFYSLFALWIMPLFAWLLLVSSFAPRMPFVFAVLPPVVIGVVEKVFFNSEHFFRMLGSRAEGFGLSFENNMQNLQINGPEDIYSGISLEVFANGLANSLASGSFWMGLLVAGAMLYGAIELRKRSLAL
jgi:ABC-2 type transport system permease protein